MLGAWGPLLVVGRREQGASPSHYYILPLVSLRPTEGGWGEGAKGGWRDYSGVRGGLWDFKELNPNDFRLLGKKIQPTWSTPGVLMI